MFKGLSGRVAAGSVAPAGFLAFLLGSGSASAAGDNGVALTAALSTTLADFPTNLTTLITNNGAEIVGIMTAFMGFRWVLKRFKGAVK